MDVNSPTFCLNDLLYANLLKNRLKVQDICLSADEEVAVEEKVEHVARHWHAASLTFKNFKSLGPVLFENSALQLLLESFEETQVLLQSLSVSKYGLPFKDTIDEHMANFTAFMELMEIWRGVQHVWWYVGVVFSSEDIGKQVCTRARVFVCVIISGWRLRACAVCVCARSRYSLEVHVLTCVCLCVCVQLPQEAQRFHKVNRVYIELMQQSFTLRYVPLVHERCEEFRNTLTSVMEDLEMCEKHLVGYLDAKRDAFARLYYISDKVLLEALSQTSGLESIQNGGVLLLFGNIKKLVLAQGMQEQHHLIESVQSDEGELLEFKTPVRENSVEILLTHLEKEMKVSMHALTLSAIKTMVPNLSNNFDIQTISSEYPCQSCILAIQCWFTTMCEGAFHVSGDMSDMKEVSRKIFDLGAQLARDLRGPLLRTIRSKLEALTVVNMTHQDVVKNLITDFVKDKHSWNWQRQLKFASDEQKNVFLEAVMYKNPHTYEFVGCKKRLIYTAETNKSYLFMLHTIASKQCVSLAGTSGCGKSETIQELGRMLGRFVLQFNCSAEVGLSSINNIIAGLNKTGTWVSFDELGRLQAGLLSVMAQRLLSVLNTIRGGGKPSTSQHRSGNKDVTALDNVATPGGLLNASGIFCCTNMKLSIERSRLPDNLRACVRALAVVEPEIEVVVFVKLSLASFTQAQLLSSKINYVYTTCNIMLSDKPRYNFDLRNALAVVNTLVERHHKNKLSRDEELTVAAKTISDFNEPQMDEEDIPVLRLVLTDVFGFKKLPMLERTASRDQERDTSTMEGKIGQELDRMKLLVPAIEAKCMQAYDLSSVRSGITLLGRSFSGKSLCVRTLLQAMSVNSDMSYKAIYMNPVALGAKHLFGWYDSKSNEWTDGTFTAIWRKAGRSESVGTWVVMDGPINPMWIEYLNTMLEDSQIFTLANGDRIATKSGNKLVLEVDQLLAASPATISRTGIVHFPHSTIGHQTVLRTWLAKRRSEESSSLSQLFERLVEPVIEAARNESSDSSVPVNIPAQARQFCQLLESFLANSVLADDLPVRQILERYVLLSAAWAFTGPMSIVGRKKIDSVFQSVTSNLPDSKAGTLVDNILIDTSGGASQVWAAAHKLCDWTFPTIELGDDSATGRIPKFIVPTTKSVAMEFLSKWMVDPRTAIVAAGARGVGKSTVCDSVLNNLRSKKKLSCRVTLSLQTTNHQFQNMLERSIGKRQGNHYGPVPGKSLLVLIEDLNMPQKDPWGDEPCSEGMRFLLESTSLCSLQKPGDYKILEDMNFIATAHLAQKGGDLLSDRLRSRCLVAMLPEPDQESQMSIFETIVQGRNKMFPAVAYETKDMFVHAFAGVIKLVNSLQEDLMPCRRLHHWSFSMHNVARLCQALMAMPPDANEIASDKTFASFYCHECERELSDQLPEDDRPTFHKKVEDICKSRLKVDMKLLRQQKSKYAKTIWTDLSLRPAGDENADSPQSPVRSPVGDGRLRPIESTSKFLDSANAYLQNYNQKVKEAGPGGKVLDLVMFPDLVGHLLRIVRVLKMERGHSVLLGAPRCGKKSIVHLAAYILQVSSAPCVAGCLCLHIRMRLRLRFHMRMLGRNVLMYGGMCAQLKLMTISSTEATNIKVVHDTIRQGFTHAGLRQERTVIAVSIDRRVGLKSIDAIFCAIRNSDMQLLISRDDFDRLLNGDEFQKSVQEYVLSAPVPEAIDLKEVFRDRVKKNIHFVLSFAISLQEISDLQMALPAECVIDVWLPYGQEALDSLALEVVIALEARIDRHTETVLEPDVQNQIIEDIALEKERQEAEGFATFAHDVDWDDEDQEHAAAEAIKIQREFRELMKQHIRLVMPRQLSMVHLGMVKLNHEFTSRTGHRSYLSSVSFRGFCRSFQDKFMEQFEKEYTKRVKLRIAIKTVARCETDLSKAEQQFAEQQALNEDQGTDYCESIMTTIKTRTAALEKVKLQLSDLESQLIFAHDRLEDMQEEYERSVKLRESETAKVVRHLQFFTPDVVNEISRITPVPASIGHLLDVVLIMLNYKINKIQMVETNLRTTIKDSWMHAVNLLKRPSEFCQTLQDLNLDAINAEQLELIQPYITSEDLSADKMGQVANGLAAPLVPWIHSIVRFCEIASKSLKTMELFAEVSKSSSKLQQEVDAVRVLVIDGQEEVEIQRIKYDEAVNRKQTAVESKERRRQAITTASELIVGLRVQQARWSAVYLEYVEEVGKISGNSSLAAAFLNYCGILDSEFRFR